MIDSEPADARAAGRAGAEHAHRARPLSDRARRDAPARADRRAGDGDRPSATRRTSSRPASTAERRRYLGPVAADAGGLLQWIDVGGAAAAVAPRDPLFKEPRQSRDGRPPPAISRQLLKAVDGAERRVDRRSAHSSAPCRSGWRRAAAPDARRLLEHWLSGSRGRAAGADRSGRRAGDVVLPRPRRVRRAGRAWPARTWLRAARRGRWLLSLPCSTGEEPYSMAMALLDAGVPPDRFRIDAVDISDAPLAQARSAPSTGGIPFAARSWRSATGISTRVGEGHPRRATRPPAGALSRGQPVRRRPPAGRRAPTTSIFCRNVLIYFDRADAGSRARDVLPAARWTRACCSSRRRKPALPAEHDFVSTKEPLAFAFRSKRRRERYGAIAGRGAPDASCRRRPSARARRRAPTRAPRRKPKRTMAASAASPAATAGQPRALPPSSSARRCRDISPKPRAAARSISRASARRRGVLSPGPGARRDGDRREAAELLPQGALSRPEPSRGADPPRAPAGEAGRPRRGASLADRARRLRTGATPEDRHGRRASDGAVHARSAGTGSACAATRVRSSSEHRALPQLPGLLAGARSARSADAPAGYFADGLEPAFRRAAERAEARRRLAVVVIFRVGAEWLALPTAGLSRRSRACAAFIRCRTGGTASCSAWRTSAANCWSACRCGARRRRLGRPDVRAASKIAAASAGCSCSARDGAARRLPGRRGARHPSLRPAGAERRAGDGRQGRRRRTRRRCCPWRGHSVGLLDDQLLFYTLKRSLG